MRKVAHILKPNKRKTSPQHFIFFDVETYPEEVSKNVVEHKFKLGVACYWRIRKERSRDTIEWVNFEDIKTFWKFVSDKVLQNKTLYLIAHNISFDFKVVRGFEAMKKRGFKLTLFITNQRTNIWKFKKAKKRITILDNLNYFGMSLKKLGDDIGLKKREMPEQTATKSSWFYYCVRDVEILFQAWKDYLGFLKEHDLGTFAPTAASQSLNAFRHRFLTAKIYIHNFEEATELERESYHGGRVECFFIGKASKQIYYMLDVNSMYPFLMKRNEYPIKFLKYKENSSLFELKRWLKNYSVIARVKIKTPLPIFSARVNDRLCFPTGIFESVLTTNELKLALLRGYIKSVLEIACYEKQNIFRKYIDYFYQIRQKYKEEKNSSYELMTKLFMNSLYGKFGQRNDVWEFLEDTPEVENCYWEEWDIPDKRLEKLRCIEGRTEISRGKVEGYNSFPGISSEVTANARLLLWNLIEKAGIKNVFYCDTDSLIVNSQGLILLEDFIDSQKIGYLKVEDTSKDLIIYAPKHYKFGQELKIKGVKKNAEMIDDFHFVQWQFEGLKGALRKGNLNKQVMTKMMKSLKKDYKKGRVLKTGRVVPFKLDEICVKDLF